MTTHGERVRSEALAKGVELWAVHGAQAVSARRVGQEMGLTHAGVLYHFGTAAALVDAVAAEAVRVGHATVVAQLITANHPAVKDMPGDERARYLVGFNACKTLSR